MFSAPGPQTLTTSETQQAGLTPGQTRQAGILQPVAKSLMDCLLPGGHSPTQGAKWPPKEATRREEGAVEFTELVRLFREERTQEGPSRHAEGALVPSPLGLWIPEWDC